MKNVCLFLFLFGLQNVTLAQPSYEVIETPKWLLKKQHNSYTINMFGVDEDMITPWWEEKMKDAGGEKIKNIKKEGISGYKNVQIPQISKKPIQVYFSTYEDTEAVSTHLTVWFKVDNQFISTRMMPKTFQPICRLLLEFSFHAEDLLKEYIRQEDENARKKGYPKIKN